MSTLCVLGASTALAPLTLFCCSSAVYHCRVAKISFLLIQWNLRNKTIIRAKKSGLIFEVVLILRIIIHVYMDLGLNRSGLIFRVVI